MYRLKVFSFCLIAALLLTLQAGAEDNKPNHNIRHVLLISVDGMHALDLTNYIATHPQSTLAQLSAHGNTYTNASTSQPSDSFPGLASLVTGGSPVTTGLWYDVTFNRKLSPPAATNPILGPTGAPNLCPGTVGTVVELDESVDIDLTALNGGGGINPNFLPRDPNNGCAPVFPHNYLRVNTIFEVVRANGGYTAWTDKHPSYEWTNGPSGQGVNDFFGPEINSNPVALPQFAGCSPVPAADNTPDDGWTTDLNNIKCYDLVHVQAIINQIDGFTHDRSRRAPVPTVFGTNFQSVSVGQKLKGNGYQDVLGTPSAGLAGEFDFVDQSLGQMVSELKKQGLFNSTLIIIAAKHGQSPIDVQKRVGIGNGEPQTTIGPDEAFDISDDGSLIWLTDSSLTASVVAKLSLPATQQALGIQEIFALNSLQNKFNSPLDDPRTPDIILKTNTGVIFTGGSKLAEHGGFNEDDVHTVLLVSSPHMKANQVKTAVSNQQVAPTILRALGIDPNELEAVRKEQIHVLPFLFNEDNDRDGDRH
ncbi:MAG TPA: alkaline phosphatase family protein [Candidatus Angelobacter sp.]|nr:alkaline phosphatase family protein [Candidatus Angelobacter sp.]